MGEDDFTGPHSGCLGLRPLVQSNVVRVRSSRRPKELDLNRWAGSDRVILVMKSDVNAGTESTNSSSLRLSFYFPTMFGSHGLGTTSESQPIPLSSSESEALAIMPKSIAITEGTSSRPSTPIVPSTLRAEEHYEWVNEEVLLYRSNIIRSNVNLLMVNGGWVRKPYIGRFDMVHCSPSE
ncbi:hypothetical protein CR513_25028, partial [Mucuna pruriens]